MSSRSPYLTGKKVLSGTKLQRVKITNVIPPHDVSLQESMSIILRSSLKKNGWIERPLLGYRFKKEVYCITGSHRIKVAKRLKLKTIPVLIISNRSMKHLKSVGFVGDGNQHEMITFFYMHGVFASKKSKVPKHYLKYIALDQGED
jgi:hypothetical protein